MRYIYILISTTPTKFGFLVRKLGSVKYNHAAIALTEDLSELYAFARKKHSALLSGRLMKENLPRYTLRNRFYVNCRIYKVPVEDEQYNSIRTYLMKIYNDDEYIYNLFSVITYPLIRGFHTHKAFSCIEFVMHILKRFTAVNIGKKRIFEYKPDDIIEILDGYELYSGTLNDYMKGIQSDEEYFRPMTACDVKEGFVNFIRLICRPVSKGE